MFEYNHCKEKYIHVYTRLRQRTNVAKDGVTDYELSRRKEIRLKSGLLKEVNMVSS